MDTVTLMCPATICYSYTTGMIPYDGRPEDEITTIHPAVTAIFVFLALCGIAFTIFCLAFNFKYRKSK